MQIIFDIPNAKIGRIADAFAAKFGYQATITDAEGNTTPNPVTKQQFIKNHIASYIKQVTASHEGDIAAETARTVAANDVSSINII